MHLRCVEALIIAIFFSEYDESLLIETSKEIKDKCSTNLLMKYKKSIGALNWQVSAIIESFFLVVSTRR